MEVQSVTGVSCALTHPGWNNDIPHHVIQPPQHPPPHRPRPFGSPHPRSCRPAGSGTAFELLSWEAGFTDAQERGYGVCLQEYMSHMKDILSESPEPALPRASISNSQSPPAQGGGGSCTLQLMLSWTRGPTGGCSSPLPNARAWQGFPQA